MTSFLRTLLQKTSVSSLSSSSPSSSSPPPPPPSSSSSSHSQNTDSLPPFDENPCLACRDPCEHPKIPEYLLKKIDYETPLEGTVKPHERHVLVCTGQTDWPQHAEQENASLMKYLSEAAKEIKDNEFKWTLPENTHPSTVVVTSISRPTTGHSTQLPFLPASHSLSATTPRQDVILLPEGILIPSVPADPVAVHALFDTWLGQNHEFSSEAVKEALGASDLPYNWIVLTCGHKKRDKRCGVAGPMIAETFKTELTTKGFVNNSEIHPECLERDVEEDEEKVENEKKNVGVWLCSHTGGHKYAGNVIVYPGGIWYGRVQPCHVPRIVERHLIGGQVVRELYRGKFSGPENGRTLSW